MTVMTPEEGDCADSGEWPGSGIGLVVPPIPRL